LNQLGEQNAKHKQDDDKNNEVFQMLNRGIQGSNDQSIQGTCMQSIPNLHSCQELIKNKSQEVNKLVVTHKPCPNRIFKYVFKPLHEDFENNLVWAVEKYLTPCAQWLLIYIIKRRRNGTDVWAGQTYLGEHVLPGSGYSRFTILRAAAELESYGLIAKYYRHWQTCLYEVRETLKQTHIIKLLGKRLSLWYEGFKSMFTGKVTLVVKEDYLTVVISNLLLRIAQNSKKGSKWVEGVYFPQRFEKDGSDYQVKPKPRSANRAEHYKKGGSYSPNYYQQPTVIREDKDAKKKIIVLVEEKHKETYYASDVRKKVPWMDGFIKMCESRAELQKNPQLRAAPLME